MKTVILGAGGQLAHDLQTALADWEPLPFQRAQLDIRDHSKVQQILTEISPEVVINAAAFVRVDDCEDMIEEAFQTNAFAVRNLAQVCKELDCVLVHFSTDYVFGGKKRSPYSEDDVPDPLNVYGTSKLASEYFVRNTWPRHFLIRSSGLYGKTGSRAKGGNFVEVMLRLARNRRQIRVVNDQILAPTYTADLAMAAKQMLTSRAYGLYHVANSGECSWFELAEAVFRMANLRPRLAPIDSEGYGAKAVRPAYSVLGCEKLSREFGLRLRPWQEALNEHISNVLDTQAVDV